MCHCCIIVTLDSTTAPGKQPHIQSVIPLKEICSCFSPHQETAELARMDIYILKLIEQLKPSVELSFTEVKFPMPCPRFLYLIGQSFFHIHQPFPQYSCSFYWRYTGVDHNKQGKSQRYLEEKFNIIYFCHKNKNLLQLQFWIPVPERRECFQFLWQQKRTLTKPIIFSLCLFSLWCTINKKLTDNSKIWRHRIVVPVFLQIWSTHTV